MKRVLIAASGSGGHLFPALHIAKSLALASPGLEIEFVGSGRPLEEKLIDVRGYKRHILPATRVMHQGIGGLARFFFSLPRSWSATSRLLRERVPDAVVGVGGYASVMPILVAWWLGIPTWVHEAELHPGLANRVLALFATVTSVARTEATILVRGRRVVTGQPVRDDLSKALERMPSVPPRALLVLGGSQGARGLDEALPQLSSLLKTAQISVVHQTRADHRDAVAAVYASAGVQASVVTFIDDMPGAYRDADIIVSRSGANSVTELEVVNRPTILVPYPHAQGNHQYFNALPMVKAGKALLVTEGEQFVERLGAALKSLTEESVFRTMREAPYTTQSIGAANSIADGILRLVK